MGEGFYFWRRCIAIGVPFWERGEGIFAIIIPIITVTLGSIGIILANMVEQYLWLFLAIPLGISIMIVSPYKIWQKDNAELRSIKNAMPLVVYADKDQTPMWYSGQKGPNQLHIKFRNDAQMTAASATAKSVTAKLCFFSKNTCQPICDEYIGQWAITTGPEESGYTSQENERDMPVGFLTHSLIVAEKEDSNDFCTAYAKKIIDSADKGQNTNYRIENGENYLKVMLRGGGVNEEYWFLFTNQGSSGVLGIKLISKPNIDKSNSENQPTS